MTSPSMLAYLISACLWLALIGGAGLIALALIRYVRGK